MNRSKKAVMALAFAFALGAMLASTAAAKSPGLTITAAGVPVPTGTELTAPWMLTSDDGECPIPIAVTLASNGKRTDKLEMSETASCEEGQGNGFVGLTISLMAGNKAKATGEVRAFKFECEYVTSKLKGTYEETSSDLIDVALEGTGKRTHEIEDCPKTLSISLGGHIYEQAAGGGLGAELEY